MVLNIYDSSLTKIGMLADPITLIWSESYSDAGAFTLTAFKDADTARWLKIGNYVGVKPYNTLMIIFSVEDKDKKIYAYGAEAKYLLTTRIYDDLANCAKVETSLKSLVSSTRPLPIWDIYPSRGLSATLRSQRSYKSLFDISKAWCDAVGYGFRMTYADGVLYYDIYAGQTKDIVFGERFGTLFNLRRMASAKDWANVALVGNGDDADRVNVWAGDTAAEGAERSEIYVLAADIEREEGQTDEEYADTLRQRGIEELNNHNAANQISFEISGDDFGVSYALGDIITVSIPESGIYLQLRITGFTETYEANKKTLALTIGEPVLKTEV